LSNLPSPSALLEDQDAVPFALLVGPPPVAVNASATHIRPRIVQAHGIGWRTLRGSPSTSFTFPRNLWGAGYLSRGHAFSGRQSGVPVQFRSIFHTLFRHRDVGLLGWDGIVEI